MHNADDEIIWLSEYWQKRLAGTPVNCCNWSIGRGADFASVCDADSRCPSEILEA